MHISHLLPWRSAGQYHNQQPLAPGGNEPLSAIQADIDEAYRRFWDMMSAPFIGRLPIVSSRSATRPANDPFRIDVHDTGEGIDVEAELPGVGEADVGVSVGPDTLAIRVERQAEDQAETPGGYAAHERRLDHVEQIVSLPRGIDPDAAIATIRNGVLSIRVPKTHRAQSDTKHVPVQVA